MVKYSINIKDNSQITLKQIFGFLGIGKPKFYDWCKRLGIDNNHNGPIPKAHWLTPEEKIAIVNYAKKYIGAHQYYLTDGYRRIAYMGIDDNAFACSPNTVYRVLSKEGLLSKWKNKKNTKKGKGFIQPLKPHQQWHTDIKYINFKGTFLFFISILDGYSRYIVHHEIRTSMTEFDIEIVLQRALEKFPDERPVIITDNGSQYLSKDFQLYMKEVGLTHIRTSPSYPQSNGKIERFHRSLEQECVKTTSLINLKDANEQIENYVNHYNNKRLHSSLFYLRPIDFLNDYVDDLLRVRQQKIENAQESRNKFWKEKKNAN